MNKDILKKLEKQLQLLKNTKSDSDNFISKFKEMCEGEEELLDWINQIFE